MTPESVYSQFRDYDPVDVRSWELQDFLDALARQAEIVENPCSKSRIDGYLKTLEDKIDPVYVYVYEANDCFEGKRFELKTRLNRGLDTVAIPDNDGFLNIHLIENILQSKHNYSVGFRCAAQSVLDRIYQLPQYDARGKLLEDPDSDGATSPEPEDDLDRLLVEVRRRPVLRKLIVRFASEWLRLEAL